MTLQILPLILFLFPLAYSPGPGNLFFAATGARFGLRGTLPALMGYHLATWIVTFALGLGFSTLSQGAPLAFQIVKGLGALYVLYLAIQFLRAGQIEATGTARTSRIIDGAALLVLNPKAYVIIALMFSQFLPTGPTIQWQQVFWITSVFTLNNFVAFLAWASLGDVLAKRFRDAHSARQLNTVFGGLLAAVATWMLFS